MQIIIIFLIYFALTSLLHYYLDDKRVFNQIRKEAARTINRTLDCCIDGKTLREAMESDIGQERLTEIIKSVIDDKILSAKVIINN